MRLLIINSFCGVLSTGRIVSSIAEDYFAKGWEVKIGYGRGTVPESSKKFAVKIGNKVEFVIHALMTRLFDRNGSGLCSYFATRRFLKWADEFNPDELWLHNLHGYYLNWQLLFKWIKTRPNMKVLWTLHDCWAFTGHCSYFEIGCTNKECNRWKFLCSSCPLKGEYPGSKFFSNAKWNYLAKRKAFQGVKRLSLITPSEWLAEQVKKSFLGGYGVHVVHNTINTEIFRPRDSSFRDRYGLAGKIVILGVAAGWRECKGLKDFFELRGILDDKYAIVLVGLNDKQLASLPQGVIGIKRTHDAIELAEIYSAVDYFFNPTHSENYPTVNLEARACGCHIVTYDTGGCKETVEGYDKAVILSGGDKNPISAAGVITKKFGG